MVVAGTSEVVAGADLEDWLFVQDVQPHQRRAFHSVHPHRIAGDGRVEPADAARATGYRPEFMAALADLVPHLVGELRGKRAIPDPRGVRLEDAEDQVDFGRREDRKSTRLNSSHSQ